MDLIKWLRSSAACLMQSLRRLIALIHYIPCYATEKPPTKESEWGGEVLMKCPSNWKNFNWNFMSRPLETAWIKIYKLKSWIIGALNGTISNWALEILQPGFFANSIRLYNEFQTTLKLWHLYYKIPRSFFWSCPRLILLQNSIGLW